MEEPTNIQMLNWARELKNEFKTGGCDFDLAMVAYKMADFIDEFIRLNQ